MNYKEYYELNEGRIGKSASTIALIGLLPLSAIGKDKNKTVEHTVTDIYRAFEYAETGSMNNKWIRTKYSPNGGSTAYGPLQITSSLVKDLSKRYPSFYKTHKSYIDKFIKQGELFAWYGNKEHKTKKDKMYPVYDKIFDYGGIGILNSDKDKISYVKMAYDMLKILLKEHKNDINKMITHWRGMPESGDKSYYTKIYSKLN